MTTETFKHIDLSTNSLTPKDILGWREKEYMEDMFFKAPIYDKIKESIIHQDITLIIGNPLSGKTRIVFDSIKESGQKWNIIIPKKDKKNTEEGYIIPTTITNILVLLDDVDDYCQESNTSLNKLLKHIINSNIKCVITCRRGPEFDRFKKYLNHNIRTRLFLNKYHIERFDKSNPDVANFLSSNKERFKSDIRNFDGNFGSVVLPLDAMRERFSKLKENEKEIPISILLGLKLHYHLLNYENSKGTFSDDKIKHFCKKYINQEISPYEWEEAKNILESTETALNFITSESDINIEEAYIDFLYDSNGNSVDVVHNDFSEKRILSLFNKLYKPEEKQPWGFPVTTRDLNVLIKKAATFKEGKDIFNKIPKSERDSFSYTYLMNLCDGKSELIALYKELRSRGIKTLFVPNHTFIAKFKVFTDLYDSLKELEPKLLEHRNSTTNRLLKLAEQNPEATLNYLFLKEPKIKIYKNPVFNQILLLCCNQYEHFELYLKPAIDILDNLDYPLKKNIIKNIIKLKLYDVAIPLVEKYLVRYDYHNEIANCKKESDHLVSLDNYIKSLKHIEFLSQEQKALTNISKLLLDNPTIVQIGQYKKILSDTHHFLKSKKQELLNLRNTEHLREALILNEIHLTDSSELMTRLEELYRLDYLSKSEFPTLVDRVTDENKLTILNAFLNKTTANKGLA